MAKLKLNHTALSKWMDGDSRVFSTHYLWRQGAPRSGYLESEMWELTDLLWNNVKAWPEMVDEDYQARKMMRSTAGTSRALTLSAPLHERNATSAVYDNWRSVDVADSAIMSALTASGIPPHMRRTAALMCDERIPVIDDL